MKKSGLPGAIGAIALIGFLGSCVSLEDKTMTAQERQGMNVLGSVTIEFTSHQFFHIPNKSNIKNKAYAGLKKAATREYGRYGDIDVRNIVIRGGGSGWEALTIVGAVAISYVGAGVGFSIDGRTSGMIIGSALGTAVGFGLGGNTQKITATGDVVLYNVVQSKLQDAVAAISAELIKAMPQNAIIAVLSIGSSSADISEAIIDELEFNFVSAKRFTVVDRVRLDQIRRERDFQLSGDVSDDSAVSIGSMLGAGIVIVGTANTDGLIGRITVRALDTRTGQIITMAREQF